MDEEQLKSVRKLIDYSNGQFCNVVLHQNKEFQKTLLKFELFAGIYQKTS